MASGRLKRLMASHVLFRLGSYRQACWPVAHAVRPNARACSMAASAGTSGMHVRTAASTRGKHYSLGTGRKIAGFVAGHGVLCLARKWAMGWPLCGYESANCNEYRTTVAGLDSMTMALPQRRDSAETACYRAPQWRRSTGPGAGMPTGESRGRSTWQCHRHGMWEPTEDWSDAGP